MMAAHVGRHAVFLALATLRVVVTEPAECLCTTLPCWHDPRCANPDTDPFKGLGCNAEGVAECRFRIMDCDGDEGNVEEGKQPCVESDECTSESGKEGCNAAGFAKLRFCSFGRYPACPYATPSKTHEDGVPPDAEWIFSDAQKKRLTDAKEKAAATGMQAAPEKEATATTAEKEGPASEAKAESPPGTKAADDTRIRLGLEWFLNPDHLPLVVALREGYFKDAGLEVELIEPTDHWEAEQEILAGRLDVAVTETLHLAQDAAAGKPVLGFSRFLHTDGGVMYLESSGIKRPRDMCGRNITYPGSPGPGGPAIVQTMVEADGGTCDLSSYGKHNGGFYHTAALESGAADVATLIFYNFEVIEARERGHRPGFFSLKEWGVSALESHRRPFARPLPHNSLIAPHVSLVAPAQPPAYRSLLATLPNMAGARLLPARPLLHPTASG